VTVTDADADKTFDVKAGSSVVALLGANPSTGFDWDVSKAPAALGTPVKGFVSGGDAMGAPGKRTISWTLQGALPAGEHVVELAYRRSFEEGKAPSKTFRFKVRAAR
jgi:predicted secreted protein